MILKKTADGVLPSNKYSVLLFLVVVFKYSFASKALHKQRIKYIPNSKVTQSVFRYVKTIQITVEQQSVS